MRAPVAPPSLPVSTTFCALASKVQVLRHSFSMGPSSLHLGSASRRSSSRRLDTICSGKKGALCEAPPPHPRPDPNHTPTPHTHTHTHTTQPHPHPHPHPPPHPQPRHRHRHDHNHHHTTPRPAPPRPTAWARPPENSHYAKGDRPQRMGGRVPGPGPSTTRRAKRARGESAGQQP